MKQSLIHVAVSAYYFIIYYCLLLFITIFIQYLQYASVHLILLTFKCNQMKSEFNVFKVFQQGDEYFELLNEQGNVKRYMSKQVLFILLFSFLYGLIMGSYNGFAQSLVTSIKIPVLIFVSLFICFPAFYVIQFMLGSKMSLFHMVNMIL